MSRFCFSELDVRDSGDILVHVYDIRNTLTRQVNGNQVQLQMLSVARNPLKCDAPEQSLEDFALFFPNNLV